MERPGQRDEKGASWPVAEGIDTTGIDDEGRTTDAEIVAGMRRGETRAVERFIGRHHRLLLDYARRAGLPSDERDAVVGELLEDVAMQLMTQNAPLPTNLRLYLLTALRNRLVNWKRARERRNRVVSEAARDSYADCDFAQHGDVAAGSSQANVRASRGPGWERVPLPRALERLSTHLSEGLSDDERQLLVAVAENVPQREIAEWLGVSYVVVRKRLERLRARLTEVAMRYTNTLEPDDARELQRFFRRCRSRIGACLHSSEPDDSLAREA
jgi:RNA polymerase sigma factor (sigma-70 family)